MSKTLHISLFVLSLGVPAVAADDAGIDFFERRIRPVLIKECAKCHSAKAQGELKGNLNLDFREGLLTGGDSGPAIVPGKPDESLLIEALNYDSFEMPPKGKLDAKIIADFKKWIEMGAPIREKPKPPSQLPQNRRSTLPRRESTGRFSRRGNLHRLSSSTGNGSSGRWMRLS